MVLEIGATIVAKAVVTCAKLGANLIPRGRAIVAERRAVRGGVPIKRIDEALNEALTHLTGDGENSLMGIVHKGASWFVSTDKFKEQYVKEWIAKEDSRNLLKEIAIGEFCGLKDQKECIAAAIVSFCEDSADDYNGGAYVICNAVNALVARLETPVNFVEVLNFEKQILVNSYQGLSEKIEAAHNEVKKNQEILKDFKLDLDNRHINEFYADEIDRCKELIDSQPQTAASQLKKLKEEIWSRASNSIKYRLLVNLGQCYQYLDRFDLAADNTLAAASYAESDKARLLAEAVGYLFKGDYLQTQAAAKKIIKIDADNSNGYSLLVFATSYIEKINFEELVPERYRDDPENAYAIARAYWVNGESDEARYWAKCAYYASPSTIQYAEIYGRLLVEPILEANSLYKQLTEQQRDELLQAKDVLYPVWEENQDKEVVRYCRAIGITLYNIYILLEDEDRATPICYRLMELFKDDSNIIKMMVVNLMLRGETKKALELVRQHLLNDKGIVSTLISLLVKEGRIEEAYDVLSGWDLNNFSDLDRKMHAAEKCNLAFLLNGLSGLKKDFTELSEDLKTSIFVTAVVSKCYFDGGDPEEAKRLAHWALESSSEETAKFELRELASCLYRIQDFTQAARVYVKLIVNLDDSVVLREYVVSLLNSENRATLDYVLNSLSEEDKDKDFYLEIAIQYKKRTEPPQVAIGLIEKYFDLHKEELALRLDWIALNHQIQNDDVVRRWAKKLPDVSHESSHHQIQLAQMLCCLGLYDSALKLGMQVYRANNSEPAVKEGYAALFFPTPPESELLIPEVVEELTWVGILSSTNEKTEYCIAPKGDNPMNEKELSYDHLFTKKMLGLGLGEKFKYIDAYEGEVEYTVVSIRSAYIELFREILNQAKGPSTQFENLRQIKILDDNGDINLELLKRIVPDNSAVDESLLNFYLEKDFPIGMLSHFARVSALELWERFYYDPSVPVCSIRGIGEEYQEEIDVLQKKQFPIVLNLSSLHLAFSMQVEDILSSFFEQIYVPMSSKLALQQHIDSRNLIGSKAMNISVANDGNLVRHEYSEEDRQESIKFYEKMLLWIEKYCDVVPAVPKTDYLLETDGGALLTSLEASQLDTIYVASGMQAVLLAEDCALKGFAKKLFEVPHVGNLQQVLHAAWSENVLSLDDYVSSVVSLVQMNVTVTNLEDFMFVHLSEKDNPAGLEDISILINSLSSDIWELSYILTICFKTLCSMWNKKTYHVYEASIVIFNHLLQVVEDRERLIVFKEHVEVLITNSDSKRQFSICFKDWSNRLDT